MVIHSLLAVDF